MSNKLKKLETIINDNIKKAWYENGLCLMEIRDSKLYKNRYTTFEDYLQKRWDYSSSYVYRLISSAKTFQMLENQKNEANSTAKKGIFGSEILPKNEAQIRPLLELESDSERSFVWDRVIQSGEKPTMAAVKDAVDEFKAHPVEVEHIKFEPVPVRKGLIAGQHSQKASDDEYYTPEKYIESVRKLLMVIDLDPASNPIAQEAVQATDYFTIDNCGLHKPWVGSVFMNPPFSDIIKTFACKFVDEYQLGNITEGVVLTNAGTDTSWFHTLLSASSAFCLTEGRISFIKNGQPLKNNGKGQVFFYFGKHIESFADIFKYHGSISIQHTPSFKKIGE